MSDRYLETASIPSRMGITRGPAHSDPPTATMTPYEHICFRGHLRIAAHAMAADMIGGWVADRAADNDWVFTTEMSVRAPLLTTPRPLDVAAETLRIGRGSITSGVHITDDTGASVSYTDLSFIRLTRRHGDPGKVLMDDVEMRASIRLDHPVADAAGMKVTDAEAGVAEVVLTEGIRNPAGAMQGAMSALLGEVAAIAFADHHLGAEYVATELDIRFLAMGRTGPMRTECAFVGPPSAGVVRVRIHDTGNDDRICYALLIRVENI